MRLQCIGYGYAQAGERRAIACAAFHGGIKAHAHPDDGGRGVKIQPMASPRGHDLPAGQQAQRRPGSMNRAAKSGAPRGGRKADRKTG